MINFKGRHKADVIYDAYDYVLKGKRLFRCKLNGVQGYFTEGKDSPWEEVPDALKNNEDVAEFELHTYSYIIKRGDRKVGKVVFTKEIRTQNYWVAELFLLNTKNPFFLGVCVYTEDCPNPGMDKSQEIWNKALKQRRKRVKGGFDNEWSE